MNEENVGENIEEEENETESVNPVNNPLTNQEYFAALDTWLRNYYTTMNMYMHMYFLSMFYQYNQGLLANQPQDMNIPLAQNIPPFNIWFRHTQAETTPHVAARPTPRRPEGAILYIIPRLWKRLVAELIDFYILFIFRYIMIFFLDEILGIISLDEVLIERYNNTGDYDAAMRIISSVILLEIIHRISVFLYEGYYLQKQVDIQHMGGATPGKIYMNLRVVKCDQVITNGEEPHTCWVKPGTNLDFKYSFARSFIKNILLVVLFPLWFVSLPSQYNRTGYDVVCHTMVVEVV